MNLMYRNEEEAGLVKSLAEVAPLAVGVLLAGAQRHVIDQIKKVSEGIEAIGPFGNKSAEHVAGAVSVTQLLAKSLTRNLEELEQGIEDLSEGSALVALERMEG